MQTRTIIDRIEIEPQTGNVGARLCKQVVADDGVTVLSSTYHRMMIAAGGDPASILAANNAHLATMGFPAVKSEDVAIMDLALAPLASFRSAKAAEAVERENREK